MTNSFWIIIIIIIIIKLFIARPTANQNDQALQSQ